MVNLNQVPQVLIASFTINANTNTSRTCTQHSAHRARHMHSFRCFSLFTHHFAGECRSVRFKLGFSPASSGVSFLRCISFRIFFMFCLTRCHHTFCSTLSVIIARCSLSGGVLVAAISSKEPPTMMDTLSHTCIYYLIELSFDSKLVRRISARKRSPKLKVNFSSYFACHMRIIWRQSALFRISQVIDLKKWFEMLRQD